LVQHIAKVEGVINPAPGVSLLGVGGEAL
jgi:hypothetical protein